MTTTRIERRKRGFFGWVFALMFWGFNLLMVLVMGSALFSLGEGAAELTTAAEEAGYAIGATLGMGLLLTVWAAGSLILGLLMFATRGSRVVIETHSA